MVRNARRIKHGLFVAQKHANLNLISKSTPSKSNPPNSTNLNSKTLLSSHSQRSLSDPPPPPPAPPDLPSALLPFPPPSPPSCRLLPEGQRRTRWRATMETLMVDRVQNSLRFFMYRNAIFLCERLCAEFPTEVRFGHFLLSSFCGLSSYWWNGNEKSIFSSWNAVNDFAVKLHLFDRHFGSFRCPI